ncbi:tyrosine-type recombinase/integrase [Companilactobacillus keshanensis]|uniref:Tyrosine-type recombinase/integrase n=1 Tax=Companilactobacillus keshanensis TaxID=2486003 RepID=A0ABW4BVV2_9LACO|nr:tyrosine-type recombinase/integrase [Companilactobacillus keshanensis]
MEIYKRYQKKEPKKFSWTYRIRYYDENGKKKPISKSGFKTSKEARIAGGIIELKYNQSGISEKENITFHDYAQSWIDTYKKDHISEHSYYIYSLIPTEIKNCFHETKLKDITKADYQNMITAYGKNHVRESVSKMNSRIKAIVQEAVDERIVYTNFTHNISIASKVASKDAGLKYIDEIEAKKLKTLCLQSLDMNSIGNYEIVFGLLTGCRIGEVSGLTWNNVHFKNKTVSIVNGYDYNGNNGFKDTKTESSNRTIRISDELLSILKKLKKQQRELFLKQGYRDIDNLVFRNGNHQIISDNAVNKSLTTKLRDKVKSKNIITFHGLRHTHASILISHGVDIAYVSQRLGHKNVAITLNIYSHLLQKAKSQQEEKAMEILQSELN